MNDEQYNKLIKRGLEENEEVFFSDIKHNKNKTWNLIEHRLEKKRVIPLWFYNVAASVILLFGISFFFKYEMKIKNVKIVELNQKLAKLENQESREKIKIITKTDTIKLIKEKLVYVPVIEHNTIVKYDTIYQQITLTDTIFIKEKLPELIAKNEISKNLINNQNVNSNNQLKTKKKRRFVFRFGMFGNSNVEKVQNEPLLSLKTELK